MLIIYGSTGVGKSDFACAIAREIPAEIINMDVGQLYTPLSIGTAKPNWRNEPTPHHFFDIINEPKNYTVVQYRQALHSLVGDIRQRGNLPIIVGGSGFYLKSLFFPPHDTLRTQKSVASLSESEDDLWTQLYEIDPDRALSIKPHDTYRLQRALDLWITTGNKPSLHKPSYTNIFGEYFVLYLNREREDLYTRINGRVSAMFDQGWIEEVEQLTGTNWIPFIEQKKIIGYNEVVDYIKNNKPSDLYPELIANIQKRTRYYARKQGTFWRMFEKNIAEHFPKESVPFHTINLTSSDHVIYIKQLLDARNTFIRGCTS